MKIFPQALQKAARDSIVGSVIGVVSFCLAISLIYLFLWFAGYSYNAELYITKMVAVATVVTAVGTTANAYRERKQKKKERIQKVITENRYRWLEQVRIAAANLYATERTYIDSASKDSEKTQKLIKDINIYISQVLLYLPYEENVLCDEIYCLAKDVKNVDLNTDNNSLSNLLCRIRA